MNPAFTTAVNEKLSFRAEQADFLFHSRSECRPAQSRNLFFLLSKRNYIFAIEETHA